MVSSIRTLLHSKTFVRTQGTQEIRKSQPRFRKVLPNIQPSLTNESGAFSPSSTLFPLHELIQDIFFSLLSLPHVSETTMSLDLSQILAALPSPKSSPSRLSNETTNRLSASRISFSPALFPTPSYTPPSDDIQTLRAVSPSNTSAGASARVDGDDPFAMFLSRSSRGKRACRVSRWLKDLHNQSSALTPTGADPFGIDPMDPRCHPYPASSHPTSTVLDDNDSMNDYVVVSNAEEQNPIASQSCEATRVGQSYMV